MPPQQLRRQGCTPIRDIHARHTFRTGSQRPRSCDSYRSHACRRAGLGCAARSRRRRHALVGRGQGIHRLAKTRERAIACRCERVYWRRFARSYGTSRWTKGNDKQARVGLGRRTRPRGELAASRALGRRWEHCFLFRSFRGHGHGLGPYRTPQRTRYGDRCCAAHGAHLESGRDERSICLTQ